MRVNAAISRLTGARPILYAAAVAGLGGLLLSHTFVYVWAPLGGWVPWRDGLTRAYGTVMLLSALGLSWRKTAVASSLILTVLFLGWLLLVQVPCIVTAPSTELLWSGAAQLVSVVAGGFILFASPSTPVAGTESSLRGARAVRLTRRLYAIALVYFGLHHFFNAADGAAAVPAWLPWQVGWVYLTGVGHVAAGGAILVGIAARPAAILEAIMIMGFVLLVHVPGVVGAPRDGLQWSMLADACAIGGAAWIVARSYGGAVATRGMTGA